jgi:Starch-binding associating with outer membrane
MKIKNLIITALAMLSMTACQNFDELSVNPNAPTSASAPLIFTKVCADMYHATDEPWSDAHKYAQMWCLNYEYYGNQNYNWTATGARGFNYGTLNDVVKMEEGAVLSGGDAKLNPYATLGKFFRAFYYVNMSQRVGDLPLSEALQGDKGISKPKYDTQKAVYVQVLKWLEEANTELQSLSDKGDKTLTGDIYFGNDLKKWQKAVNSYRLRVLVSLSKKEADADLNIKAKFADIVNNPTKNPIFASASDNLAYTYTTVTNKYPTNPDNFGFNATRWNMAETYVKTLTDLKDPRVFHSCEPADSMLRKGFTPSSFEAYLGANSGESLADMSSKVNFDLYSFVNRYRYYRGYEAEKYAIVGYTEQCFNIAEGLNRGWATASADTYYKAGISAAMAGFGITNGANTGYYVKKGAILGNFTPYTFNVNITEYNDQAAVKYKGNTADGLNQILTQKYLGFFQQSGWEAFYNQRRTGVPNFSIGDGNTNGKKIPKRWQYPTSERTNNADNWKAALNAQFGNANDDINSDMWLIK